MAQPFNNMNIYLFKYKKKTNSTKHPDTASGHLFDCTINEDTSIISPNLRINKMVSAAASVRDIRALRDTIEAYEINTILDNGVISDTSDYREATFSDISDYDTIYINFKVGNTEQFSMIVYNVANIGTGVNLSIHLQPNNFGLQFTLTKTSIRATYYPGDWQNITATIYTLIEHTEPVPPTPPPPGPDQIQDLNYAYIPKFNRWYFISNTIYELGTWYLQLRCDVLATYKTEIGNSSHYIERCSYEFDGDIIDGLYPEKTDPELVIAEPDEVAPGVLPCIFGDTTTPGITPSYIVGIIGGIAQENIGAVGDCYNGSVVYFAMAQDQLGDFIASLLNSVNLYAIDPSEISYDLQKQLINPIQYIESIKCVPFMPSATSNYVAKQYYLGFQYMDVPYAYGTVDPKTGTNRSWNICKAPTIGADTTNYDNGYLEFKQNMMKLPLHPEMDSRGHWVLSSPISKYVFTCEPFGQIEIPSGNIMHAPITTPQSGDPYIGLWYSICFDISTGDCTLFLSWDPDIKQAFIKVTKNCCIPVPVHQSVQDVMTFRQDMRALGFQAIEGAFGLVKSSVNAVGGTQEVSNSQTLTASKTEYDIGGPIGSAVNTMDKMMKTIDDATMANQVKISGNSANGSYMSFNKDLCMPRVFCYFTPLAEEHNEERGKPLCAVRQLSTIPGYILCSGAEIETYGTAEENNSIASFLNGGFYYE